MTDRQTNRQLKGDFAIQACKPIFGGSQQAEEREFCAEYDKTLARIIDEHGRAVPIYSNSNTKPTRKTNQTEDDTMTDTTRNDCNDAEISLDNAGNTARTMKVILQLTITAAENMLQNISAAKKMQKETGGGLPTGYADMFISNTRDFTQSLTTILYEIIDKTDAIIASAED